MKKLVATLLCCLLISPVTFAEEKVAPPTKLTEGQTFQVPEDGWFFTVPAEKKIRYRLLDADYFEKAFKLSEDTNGHLQKQLELQEQISEKYRKAWLESDDRLTEVLKRENRTKFWYLTLGIILTVGAGFAVGAAAGGL